MNKTDKLITYVRLGLPNLIDVLWYRASKSLGLQHKSMPVSVFEHGVFFRGGNLIPKAFGNKALTLQQADQLQSGQFPYFSHQNLTDIQLPPKWRCTPEGAEAGSASTHWASIPDFNPAIGDIKIVWELSRFDWLLVLARACRHSSDTGYIETLNRWLADWCRENPVNGGPNWKCGQEASIRLMQTLLAAFLLGEYQKPEPALVQFVVAHCRRIAPTLRYAMAQDNNHGTSEAAALFMAGAWLEQVMIHSPDACTEREVEGFTRAGRKWLENRARKLIEADGSFSQYSVNYHRVMLDTLSMAEFWRLLMDQPAFSKHFYRKAMAATDWLRFMTNPANGDVPNLGANDGARLFVLSNTAYRDFRPSVQLASVLFSHKRVYEAGPWDEALGWLGLDLPSQHQNERPARLFDQGGYCFLHQPETDIQLYVRYPRFRFRPGQADALHLDLWRQGSNIVRDSGSYSYNTAEPWQSYFPGTQSHSTVQFDDRDQMPRLSRFLFGSWLKPLTVSAVTTEQGAQCWSCSYRDAWGACHQREIKLEPARLTVTDRVSGFRDKAVLRWRLMPGEWVVSGHTVSLNGIHLSVNSEGVITRFSLETGYESRYYNEKTPLPVLEVETATDAVLVSTFVFS